MLVRRKSKLLSGNQRKIWAALFNVGCFKMPKAGLGFLVDSVTLRSNFGKHIELPQLNNKSEAMYLELACWAPCDGGDWGD